MWCNSATHFKLQNSAAHGSEVEHAIRGAAIGGLIEVLEGQLQVPRLGVSQAAGIRCRLLL